MTKYYPHLFNLIKKTRPKFRTISDVVKP